MRDAYVLIEILLLTRRNAIAQSLVVMVLSAMRRMYYADEWPDEHQPSAQRTSWKILWHL